MCLHLVYKEEYRGSYLTVRSRHSGEADGGDEGRVSASGREVACDVVSVADQVYAVGEDRL